jgi:hypothetical protein
MKKNLKEILEMIEPHCDRVIMGGKHLKAYPKTKGKPITIATTSSDINQKRQVVREFRREGINI